MGHNKVYIIGNYGIFEDKMRKTIETVNQILGLPTDKGRFKKYLVETR